MTETNDTQKPSRKAVAPASAGSVTSRRNFLASIVALVGIPTIKIPSLTSDEWPVFGSEWDIYDGEVKTHRVRAGNAGEVFICRFYNQARKGSDIVFCFAAKQPRWLSQNDEVERLRK